MISTPGIGSGLDVNSIVSQLIELESRPVVRLETRKALNDVKISSFGQISSALSELQSSLSSLKNEASLIQYRASSSDTEVFTVSASSEAAVDSYTIEVVDLADSHRLNSVLFTSEDEVVGEGTLSLTSGSNSISLTIDSSNNTVAGIRDAINAVNSSLGISASIVNVDGGTRLILSADNSGSANAIEINVTGDSVGSDTDTDGLSQLVYNESTSKNMTELQIADDGLVRIDGFDVTATSNTITDAITGVTITLLANGTADLSVFKDYSQINSNMGKLVSAYNNVSKTLSGLSSTSLSGESFLVALERDLRDVFATRNLSIGSGIESVFDIGLSFDKEGVLSFDSEKLNDALDDSPTQVVNLFADSSNGFAVVMDNLIDTYLGANGLIKSRTDGLNSRNEDLNDQIAVLNRRIANQEASLLQEFSALDGLVAQISSTGNFLNSQLDQLLGSLQPK